MLGGPIEDRRAIGLSGLQGGAQRDLAHRVRGLHAPDHRLEFVGNASRTLSRRVGSLTARWNQRPHLSWLMVYA
jgi:hypothetical protein